MRSGALSMFIVTGLLGYANKIPIIKKLIFLLSLWYGKTTIWKILSRLRKLFVLLNAFIGFYMVLKTTGFSINNILIGFSAMGHTYFEVLVTLSKSLFNWIFELFDYKIIPNVPGETPTVSKYKTPFWNPQYSHNAWGRKTYDLYNINNFPGMGYKIFNVEITPWYRDWSTLLWVAGGVITIGTIYLGYKVIMEPSILLDWFKSTPKIVETGATPPTVSDAAGSSTGPGTMLAAGQDPERSLGIGTRIVNMYHKTIYNINPLHWFATTREAQDQFNTFMDVQNDMTRSNRTLYPFTENNPCDSYLKRLRIRWLGETSSEITSRIKAIAAADSEYESIRVGKAASSVSELSPISSWSGLLGPRPLTLPESSIQKVWSATNSPGVSEVGLPATDSPLNPGAVFGAKLSSTSIALSKVPATPEVLSTTKEWITNTPSEAGRMPTLNKFQFSERCLWDKTN